MSRKIFALVFLSAASACHPAGEKEGNPAEGTTLGICTQEEPSAVAKQGHAVFTVDTVPTPGGSPVGRFALVVSCVSPGPAGAAVTVVLPNLSDSIASPGRYRVHGPGIVPQGEGLSQMAWAEAVIPTEHGVTYRGMGGELVLEKAPQGGLIGSYLVAFERAAEAPVRGPAQLVVGGAFAATRNRLPQAKEPQR